MHSQQSLHELLFMFAVEKFDERLSLGGVRAYVDPSVNKEPCQHYELVSE